MKSILLILLFAMSSAAFSQSFYDEDTIQEIRITFEQSNWDALMDAQKAGDEDYILASEVTINGVEFDSVGVKYKGNSTYSANQKKNPLHIELDTYKNHKYEDYTDIKLSNGAKDPSFLREVLSYKILRNYMDAPLSNYAVVYINDELFGLYSNSESVSKKFVDSRFGSKTNTFVKCNPPSGAGPGTTALPNLTYRGEDSSSYYSAYELKSDYGWSELIDLCDTLNNFTEDIESILDVDRALWMLAFDNILVNLDSYIGGFAQNYYLYKDDNNRFVPIVWDLNESFGVFSMTGSGNLNNTSSKQNMSLFLNQNNSSYPLLNKLLSMDKYRKIYLAHCKTILVENFSPESNLYELGLGLQETIDQAFNNDPNKFYTYSNFKSNLTSDISSGGGPGGGGPGGRNTPGITNLMNGRYNYLMGQSEFTAEEPTITNVAVSKQQPVVGETVVISSEVTSANSVQLKYRHEENTPFKTIEMGNDDSNAYSAEINIETNRLEYYIYAENDDISKFSPTNAEHEFYTIEAVRNTEESELVINEFLASNDTTNEDSNGDYDDWLELYNNGDVAIDLEGYSITDDITDFEQFVFPAGSQIEPGGYVVVWADGDLDQDGYHADFKISASGETLYLANAESNIIDSVSFDTQEADISYGRYPNGTGEFTTMSPTFGKENVSTITNVEIMNDYGISVYPNPTNEFVNIPTKYMNQKVEIRDLNGKLIMTSKDKTKINVSHLETGVYLLSSGNYTAKFVKK